MGKYLRYEMKYFCIRLLKYSIHLATEIPNSTLTVVVVIVW